jgi:hypothetical protein
LEVLITKFALRSLGRRGVADSDFEQVRAANGRERMSSESESSSAAIRRKSPTGLKYAIAIVTLASLWVSAFLTHLAWKFSDWLDDVSLVCVFVVLVLSVLALFRRKWKELALFSLTLAVAFLPAFGLGPVDWLIAEGFRIHASPIEEYRSRCKLVDFVENGFKQTVGRCEGHSENQNEYFFEVIYDPTGENLKPVSHRTQAWQTAMSEFYSDKVLNSSERRTTHIFGDFYLVSTTLED